MFFSTIYQKYTPLIINNAGETGMFVSPPLRNRDFTSHSKDTD